MSIRSRDAAVPFFAAIRFLAAVRSLAAGTFLAAIRFLAAVRSLAAGTFLAAVRFVAAGTLLLTAGCTEGERDGATDQVFDSAGVEVVVNPTTTETRWSVHEVVRVGSLDGPAEELFDRPGAVLPDGEGGVLVAERGENAFRHYGPDGSFRGRLGGAGEGPGEFARLGAAARIGDTVVAFDTGNRRLTRFGGAGEVLDTRALELDFTQQGVPNALHPLSDGRLFLATSHGCSMPPPEDRRPRRRVFLAQPSGGERVSATGPVAAWVNHGVHPIYGERFCGAIPSLAGHQVPLAIRPDGLAAAAPGPGYEIHLFQIPGDDDRWRGGALDALPPAIRIIRREVERHPVTDVQRQGYRERFQPSDLTEPMAREQRDAVRAAWDSTEVPDRYPAIQALHWDDRDRLWVQRRGPYAGSHGPWDVFDEGGRLLAEVELPPDLAVRRIHGGRVWGVEEDELEVPHLVGIEVLEGEGPAPARTTPGRG